MMKNNRLAISDSRESSLAHRKRDAETHLRVNFDREKNKTKKKNKTTTKDGEKSESERNPRPCGLYNACASVCCSFVYGHLVSLTASGLQSCAVCSWLGSFVLFFFM